MTGGSGRKAALGSGNQEVTFFNERCVDDISFTTNQSDVSGQKEKEAADDGPLLDFSTLSLDIIHDVIGLVHGSRIKALKNLAQIEGPWSDVCCRRQFIYAADNCVYRRHFNSEKKLCKTELQPEELKRSYIEDVYISDHKKDPFALYEPITVTITTTIVTTTVTSKTSSEKTEKTTTTSTTMLAANIYGSLSISLVVPDIPEAFLDNVPTRITSLRFRNFVGLHPQKLPTSLVPFINRQLRSPYLRTFENSGSLDVHHILDSLKHFVKAPQFMRLHLAHDCGTALLKEFYEAWKGRTFFATRQTITARVNRIEKAELVDHFRLEPETTAYGSRAVHAHPVCKEASITISISGKEDPYPVRVTTRSSKGKEEAY
uniref:F-box domain-containing protein n=1 Tax=Steinernema glaseri TaxID=37863 RepID=A0A1I7Z154_9BILA